MNKAAVFAVVPLVILGGASTGTIATSSEAEDREADGFTMALAVDVESRLEGETAYRPVTSDLPVEEARGCDITIRATNGGKEYIQLYQRDWRGTYQSQVRTRLGTWRIMWDTSSVSSGEDYRGVVRLAFYCNAARRYRFRLQKGGDTSAPKYTYYYPSSSTFTKNTTLNLGDLNRFF